MGNLHSVIHALNYVCSDSINTVLTHDPKIVADADAVLFPGQGAAASCMANLAQHDGLIKSLLIASDEKPFLGILYGDAGIIHQE